jgi:hypothetical protein
MVQFSGPIAGGLARSALSKDISLLDLPLDDPGQGAEPALTRPRIGSALG